MQLTLPLLIPLITAILCLLLWRNLQAQRILSAVGTSLQLLASLWLLSTVQQDGIQVVQFGGWQAPYGITFVADILSGLMVAVSALIGLCVTLFAVHGLDRQSQQFGFYSLLNILLMGVTGAFLTGDLFNMYVWFEVMLIASFVLMALGGRTSQLAAAMKYVTLNLIASALFLAATGVLYSTVGTLNMADVSRQLADSETTRVATLAATILMFSFGVKAAVFPLFFWLPASYHTPPVAITALMAGLLTKVGVYALIRTFTLLFAYDHPYRQPLLLVIAAVTMVTGVLGAAAQTDVRRILSFHIISQIGYMVLGLAIYTPLAITGTVFYLLHHIVVKANLFLIAGIARRGRGGFELSQLGGIYRSQLGLALLFLIPALSLAGIPPLSGFWAKLILIQSALEQSRYGLVAVALVVGILTLFSMTKIWAAAFWAAPAETPPTKSPGHWSLFAPTLCLATITVVIGLYAQPLFTLSEAAAEQLLDPTQYTSAVLGDTDNSLTYSSSP